MECSDIKVLVSLGCILRHQYNCSALLKLRFPKRSFLMTHLSFPGSGKYSGIDVTSSSPTWIGLRRTITSKSCFRPMLFQLTSEKFLIFPHVWAEYSCPVFINYILGILNYQLNGVSFVGSNVCGLTNTVTKELCIRWYQLGIFYPFLSSHGGTETSSVRSEDTRNILRSALKLRYSLLPYLYTGFYFSHTEGKAVVMPVAFE